MSGHNNDWLPTVSVKFSPTQRSHFTIFKVSLYMMIKYCENHLSSGWMVFFSHKVDICNNKDVIDGPGVSRKVDTCLDSATNVVTNFFLSFHPKISILFYPKNPIQLKASPTKLHNPCSVSAPFVWPFQLMNLSKFSPDLGQTKFMRWTVQHTHSRPQSYISLHWPWDDDIVLTISTINQDW